MEYVQFCKLVDKVDKTAEDLKKLEPFRVKRAVIMAAGLGTRMRPITNNKPKPLVTVNGVPLIETGLKALENAGITEIYIVRGYLGNQFNFLTDKYPNIKFIENVLYDKGNNITSILAAKEFLQKAYIFPADLYIKN